MMNWKRKMKGLRPLAPALLAVCVLATASAAEPAAIAPVFHSSFKAAADAAAADRSLVLLVFSAEWCGPCKLLKSQTLAAPEFLHQESPLHVADVDIDANQKMAGDFDIEAVPALVLLTADGKIILRQTGFMEPADLMVWLKTGRTRAAAGQWEGTAPGAQFNEFIQKAAADNLGTNEIQRLVGFLGDADPANREQAGKILLGQREHAMPPLIEAVGDAYLGVRISAGELLQRLAPNAMPIDPWQPPQESSNAVVALQKWWAGTGKLPPVSATPTTNYFSANSVKEALDQLRGDDAVRRTAAMTGLVRFGPSALPVLREAIERAEKSGDQRALGLLEDVRWTILVSDAVEQQSGGVRNVLARGKSSERQAATERLGGFGRDALGVLTELAGDADPLVVESAIRALSGINGGDPVAALAALLKSTDSNLRMTAAQALGHTKNAAAARPLLLATRDPDEVVACTALTALEETQSRDTYGRTARDLPAEITAGLKQCLADPRWRVRACAAEVTGKLSARGLTDDLKKLLNDPDGFVVKSALTALGKMGSTPEAEQLAGLGERLPSLQGDVAEMMLESPSDENVKAVTKLFNAGTPETRAAILGAFLRRGVSDNVETDDGWQPMFAQAVAAPDPRLRRLAAEVLGRRSPKLAAQLIGPLLADDDRETRRAAPAVVLRILEEDRGGSLNTRTYFSSSAPKTNPPVATTAQIAAWHLAMLKHAEAVPDLMLASAIYATGNGRTDLPMLLTVLKGANRGLDQGRPERLTEMAAIELIVPMLPWPEGRAVLDGLSASPIWFAMAASQSGRDRPEAADYLLEPARFKSAVEKADGSSLSETLELLAGYDYEYGERHKWSLWSETERTKALALALVDSTNAAWRAAAVFSLGLRADAKENQIVFEKALADPNPWVQASAIKAITRNKKDRPALEQQLVPLLGETNLVVATAAAVALLEPEIRQAAGLTDDYNCFAFGSVRGGRSQSFSQGDERPLTTLEGKPAYLQPVRERLAASSAEASAAFVLLLAQHGEFDGVNWLVAQLSSLNSEADRGNADVVLTGIALSRDVKYLPALKQLASVRTEESELRKVLQALKGMPGPDARQLRLEINKKIRNASGSSGVPD